MNAQILKTYFQHAWRYPHLVIALLLVQPIAVLTHQFLPPLVAANIIDRLASGDYQDGDLLGSVGGQLLLYAGLSFLGGVVMWRLTIYLIWKLEAYVVRDLARTQFNHLMKLDADFHANSFGGSLVSQTNKFSGAYIRMADTIMFQLYSMLIAMLTTIIILWNRSSLFVVFLVFFSVAFMYMATKITKPVRQLVAKEAKAQNKQTGVLADAITNIMAVKSFSASTSEKNRFNDVTDTTRKRTNDVMNKSLVMDSVFGLSTTTVAVMAMVMAAASVVNFGLELGTVYLVLQYAGNINNRLWEFSQSTLRNINRSLGDAQDGMKTLLTEPNVQDPKKPIKPKINNGGIEFTSVSFTHDDANAGDEALFENLNLSIPPGQKVGLVGHSGSGKSTLTKLILRFADIDGGKICIDRQNICDIKQHDLRRSIAYVPQEPLLFHRSIRENIGYGCEGLSEADIVKASKRANAHEFVETLPQGYETMVGERGVKLSGGQRQRIAIARAMAKNAPILILDEATSALDSESEQLIQESLWTLMSGRTAIVIAHRLSTIQAMDRIIVMEEGAIIEDGSHAELLRNGGKYADLWSHQSGGFVT